MRRRKKDRKQHALKTMSSVVLTDVFDNKIDSSRFLLSDNRVTIYGN